MSHPGIQLSIVIPFLNEEEVLPLLRRRLECLEVVRLWELLFVSDGSSDRSVQLVRGWCTNDRRIKLIELTRNFGHQAAISAGLARAQGAFVGIMDADLQDEPEALLSMFHKARAEDFDVVYAVRESRKGTLLKRLSYYWFYRVFSFLAESPVQIDSGDFCVMSRRAVDLLVGLPEHLRFIRGLRAWLGLRSVGVPVTRPARAAGRPSYSLSKLLQLATSGITAFSVKPLRLGFICGLLLCIGSALGACAYVFLALFTRIPLEAPGFTTIVVLLLFFDGLVLLYLGIIGEYIGQIFLEVKGRPAFVIRRTMNLADNASHPEATQS